MSITLSKINKIYDGGVHAVHDVSLEIADRDFVVLLGPSGCGKSTLLRMIAGLEEISFGELRFDGELVNELAPKDRNIAMVFQNYALFPHLTVYENMAFGLKNRKVDKEEIKRRVDEAAEILGIPSLLSRKPAQLSGGQKQRVALGRAIVCQPRIFLFDEPLSNLDAKLRASMRSEIIKLHRKLNATFIYVTHDQTEALTMGTKIAVLRNGWLQQVDTPSQIYDCPRNEFVATFMGSPQMNLFEVTVEKSGGALYAMFPDGGKLKFTEQTAYRLNEEYIGKKIKLGIRPENLSVAQKASAETIEAAVELIEPLGGTAILNLCVPGALNPTNVLIEQPEHPYGRGEKLIIKADMSAVQLFDIDTGVSLLVAPENNYFPATAKVEGEDVHIFFAGGDVSVKREEYLLGTLDKEIKVSLPSTVHEQPGEDDFKLKIKVNYVFRRKYDSTVFACIDGGGRFVFTTAQCEAYEAGKEYVVGIDKAHIMLWSEGERLFSKRPVKGRERKRAARKLLCERAPILDSEQFGYGHLLYCGLKDGDYCTVWVDKDFPVYKCESVELQPLDAEEKVDGAS